MGIPREFQLDFNGVYRLDPANAALTLLTSALNRPNGLCFSRDESLLYINDSPEYKIHVFDVEADGSLANQRLFAQTQGDGPGVPDGMKIDSEGNLYCCAQGGLHVYKRDGSFLGRLLTPMQVTNFTWGDDDMRSIYLTGITTLYRARTLASLEGRSSSELPQELTPWLRYPGFAFKRAKPHRRFRAESNNTCDRMRCRSAP